MNFLIRTRQFFFSLAGHIEAPLLPEALSGDKSLNLVPDMLYVSGKKNVLIVTTAGTVKRGTLRTFCDNLAGKNIRYDIFSDVSPDPTVECAKACLKAYKDANAQAVIAIGGGSVMDCAKVAMALLVNPGKEVCKLKGLLKVRHRIPDLYAVPTTAGTGSETTAAAVITDTVNGLHIKYAVTDFKLIPRYAILDPSLTVGLPPSITAATGMDALTHAVEAYTNCFASDYVKTRATDAVKLIYQNLPDCYAGKADLKARENMLVASFLAGQAFTLNFVGYVHAIAHAVGALYGIPHGEANAIILPYVLEQFGAPVYAKLARLYEAAGLATATDNTDAGKAAAFIASIRKLNANMGISDKFEVLNPDDFELIADRALAEAVPAYPTPVIWTRHDFIKLLEKLV